MKITDSDRLQEEMTALGIPCFTIQESTERPVTIDEGTDTLDGTTAAGILSAYEGFKNGGSKEVDSRNIGMAKPLNESSIFFLAGPMSRFNPNRLKAESRRLKAQSSKAKAQNSNFM